MKRLCPTLEENQKGDYLSALATLTAGHCESHLTDPPSDSDYNSMDHISQGQESMATADHRNSHTAHQFIGTSPSHELFLNWSEANIGSINILTDTETDDKCR